MADTTTPASNGPASTYKPDLEARKRDFDDARECMEPTRKLAEACRDYYDGKQLTAAQRRVLRLRKQPDVVINRTRRAIDGTLGVVEQGKTDPRAYMRNPPQQGQAPQATLPAQGPGVPPGAGPPQPGGAPGMMPGMGPMLGQPGAAGPNGMSPEPDLDAGDVASMTLRYVADRSRFQCIKMDVLEYLLVEGTAGAITEFVDNEITITLIAADEYFWDPRSRKPDFKDKRFDGIAKWMYIDDVIALYPEKRTEIEASVANGDAGKTADTLWQDKPDKGRGPSWVDQRKRRLMVVDMYHREGSDWYRCVFHSGGFLEAGPSVYLDDKGRTRNPIEAQSIYIDRELIRYGFVRDMIDIQDEINARRSKAIHEINTRQVQQVDPNAPPIEADTVRAEAARPDGVLPAGWQIVPRNDVVANSIEMLQEAKSELERLAPNPALLGRQGADASGRAQQLRAQAGLTELARPLGRFTEWEHRIYANQIWPCARQFYTDPMWIRVTDDDGAPQYVRINDFSPDGSVRNHIAQMDVDIIIDTVPDTATLEQEIWTDLVKLAETYGPQAVPFEVMIEMSPLPNKHRLIKRLKKAQAEAAQTNAQAQAIQVADATSKIDKTQSETKLNEVKAVTEAMRGHMEAMAATVIAPGVSEVANLPQNLPQKPNGAASQ